MSKSFRIGFCVSGNGHLARAAINQRERLGVTPAIVIGERRTSETLREFCEERNVPFVRIEHKDRLEFDKQLARQCIDADLNLITLSFNKILPPPLVAHYEHRIVNLHPALLPAFKGFYGFTESTTSGTRFVGMTLHEVIDAVDEGPIIAQTVIGKRLGEAPESIGMRVFGQLRQMYLQVISWYVQGRIRYDDNGYVVVKDAVYGEFPTSPSIEQAFPD